MFIDNVMKQKYVVNANRLIFTRYDVLRVENQINIISHLKNERHM